jgi:hypothetical protein
MSSVQINSTIPNTGTLRTVGVGVYWDTAFTNKTTSISWGALDPGSKKNVTVYIRNEGYSGATLSMQTSNWNPSTASTYMALTWNYNGQLINVGAAIVVKFTLSVSSSVSGITSFSFNITITTTG